jgi:molybdopterin molybdotransferase
MSDCCGGYREFLRVVDLGHALSLTSRFPSLGTEPVSLGDARGRVLGADVVATADLPGFARSIVDGFAVRAASTFGASEGSPALLSVAGEVEMGRTAEGSVGPGEAVRIPTGGMLPAGADAVVMVEHTEAIDSSTIEAARAVAPGGNVIQADEDVAEGQVVLERGVLLRSQELGLLAALGVDRVTVHRRPVVAILSTGDEVVPAGQEPGPGQVRDVNSHTLAAQVEACGGVARKLGIVLDDFDAFLAIVRSALEEADLLLVSGGSSVGTRDLTIDVLGALPDSEVLIHGVSIKPGKPTILARVGSKAVWGLPGHVASAMVVFEVLVRRFVERIGGLERPRPRGLARARLSRNVSSMHGRTDFVRVRLRGDEASPVLGRSGLIRTMVEADGLVEIPRDSEGLDAGAAVEVRLL